MRRASALLILLVCVLASMVLPAGTPARAQESGVSLTLESQSTWNSPKRPLVVRVRVENGTAASLGDLVFTVTVFPRVLNRTAYEQSLVSDPPYPVLVTPIAEHGGLRPGAARTFRLRLPLKGNPLIASDGLYPVNVTLLSKGQAVSVLRTPMIFLATRQRLPLDLAWTWELSDPLQLRPNGVLAPGPIEADIAPGGRLDAMVRALAAGRGPADVVVSSVLLSELTTMARGYRIQRAGGVARVPQGSGGAADAARMLSELRAIAADPATELVALPFSDPSLPALIAGGLGRDIPSLVARGQAQLHTALGADASPTVVRAPSDLVTPATLSRLWRLGGRVLLVDPNALTSLPLNPRGTPLPTVKLLGTHGAMTALAPDPGLVSVASAASAAGQPVLAAHAALGELAAIYFESPGIAPRGADLLLPGNVAYPSGFYPAFASLVRASPWLAPVTASTMARLIPPQSGQPQAVQSAPTDAFRSFPPGYVAGLLHTRTQLSQFEATVQAPRSLTQGFATDLLFAEGGAATESPQLGETFVHTVTTGVAGVFRRIQPPPTGYLVTLTSLRGRIAFAVRNATGHTVHLRIRLLGFGRITFLNGNDRYITLPPGDQTLTFAVQAQTTGRFPIGVQLLAAGPAGVPFANSQLIVRSTAYNRFALFLTIGAALFLLAWWGRRFLPRRGATPPPPAA